MRRLNYAKFFETKTVTIGVATLFLAYLIGGYAGRHDFFPFHGLHAVRTYFYPEKAPSSSRYTFSYAGRLASDNQKVATPCPKPTPRTAVLLLFGQSNSANHHGQRFHSMYGAQVVNFFAGQCFIAASPLLGATGSMGEYWTELGNLLIGTGDFDAVVLASVSVTGSSVASWAPGGDLNQQLLKTIDELRAAGYTPSQALWHQGEKDYVDGTSEAAYRASFLSLVKSLRAAKVDAPVFVSVASKCLEASNGGTVTHDPDNPVTRAQKALPNSSLGNQGRRRHRRGADGTRPYGRLSHGRLRRGESRARLGATTARPRSPTPSHGEWSGRFGQRI